MYIFVTVIERNQQNLFLHVLIYISNNIELGVKELVRINNSKHDFAFGIKLKQLPNIEQLTKSESSLKDLKLKGYTAILDADVYTPENKIVQQDLLLKDSKIFAIDEFDPEQIDKPITYISLKNKTITPAILDEHIHGGFGINFHNATEQKIRELLKKLKEIGTGGVIATTLPDKSIQNIRNQIKVLNNIIKNPQTDEARIFGIHLEGPFLSPKKRGIHPAKALMTPSVENYLKLEPENISIVTIAPELDNHYTLCKFLNESGVKASAGHSMATAHQLKESGATQVTHIFNAMAPIHQRQANISLEALTNDNISAEMNSDFSLLCPNMMNLVMREKPKDKLILISDALPEAGIKKNFKMNNVKIHVDDNWIASDKKGTIAGSMRFLPDVAQDLIEKTIMSFQDFIRFASVNPSKNIGVENKFQIKEGLSPIFSIWDNKTIKHEKTFIN